MMGVFLEFLDKILLDRDIETPHIKKDLIGTPRYLFEMQFPHGMYFTTEMAFL